MTNTIPRKRPALSHEVSETGEVVLFDEQGNQLLLLNQVGAAVWQLLDGARTIRQIVEVVVETLPADPAQVEHDVIEFLKSLAAHGLVELAA